MVDLLPSQSIFVDGWFGLDGQSHPVSEPIIGGWYGEYENIKDLIQRVARIEAALIMYKPIFINPVGTLEELDYEGV